MMMMLKVLAVLVVSVVVLSPSRSAAHPWRYSQLHHPEQEEEEVEGASRKQFGETQSTCTSVNFPSVSNDLINAELEVCEGQQLGTACVNPGLNFPPCCSDNILRGLVRADGTQSLSVNGNVYTVRYFLVDEGACYLVNNGVIVAPLCNPRLLACMPVPPSTELCPANLARNVVCSEGECTCKEGYDPTTGCCDCQQGLVELRGQCIESSIDLCEQNVQDCVDGECTCNEGYDPTTGCCQCLPGHNGFRECLPCDCSTSGTVNNANQCDPFGNCQCAVGFTGQKCDEELSTDVYFVLDSSSNFQTSRACEIEYAIMEAISGIEGSVSNVNFYVIINSNQRNGDAILLHQDPDNVCSNVEVLVDDRYIIAGNPSRNPTFLARGRYIGVQHEHTLELLRSKLAAGNRDQRSVAVLITGGRYISDTSEETLQGIADEFSRFSQLDIIAMGVDMRSTSRNRFFQLRRDFAIIAPNADNRIYLDGVNPLEITDQILRRFERLDLASDASQIMKGLDMGRTVTLGGRQTTPALAYCNCHNAEMSITTATQCSSSQLSRVEPSCLPSRVNNQLEREIMAAVEEVLAGRMHG